LKGSLPADEVRGVVAHLIDGCKSCQAELRPWASSLLHPEPTPSARAFMLAELGDAPVARGALSAANEAAEAAIDPALDAAYDRALDRAFASVRLHGTKAVREKERVQKVLAMLTEHGVEALSVQRDGRYPVFEALLQRSWALRHDDPAQMADLAWFATLVAKNLGRDGFTTQQVADFEARALGELGNAHRVANRYEMAEQALSRALAFSAAGTGDALLNARLFDLRASLLGDQRRFKAALDLLDVVHSTHLTVGDRHSAGRALISKGIYTGYSGEPREALRLIQQGLGLLDEGREPGLRMLALHNQIYLLVDCGLFREARTLLWQNRWQLQKVGGHIDQLKLAFLEGRINAGLGYYDRAERAFLDVKAGFAACGMGIHSGIASLDLASVLMQQGRNAEAQGVAEEAADAFIALNVEGEALAALLILRLAFERQRATAWLLQSVAEFLRRVEHDPTAQFRPVLSS